MDPKYTWITGRLVDGTSVYVASVHVTEKYAKTSARKYVHRGIVAIPLVGSGRRPHLGEKLALNSKGEAVAPTDPVAEQWNFIESVTRTRRA